MGDCELCGAMNVGTRQISMERAHVQACKRCTDKMGLNEAKMAPGLAKAKTGSGNTSGGYGGIGKKGKDIMVRGEKELASDFARKIIQARESKGWDKKELARRMAEKVNIIINAESGKRPTDSVIRKLERTLDITLMVEIKPDENRQLNSGTGRGFTLGDFLLGDKD
jgi:uncharacterized protein (TIGR00270 family)